MENKEEFNGRLIVIYPEKNLPERIRKYVTDIYEYLDSMVSTEKDINISSITGQYYIDRNLQIYYILLSLSESFLSGKAKTPNCSYFSKTMQIPSHKYILKRLNDGKIDDWYTELHEVQKNYRQLMDGEIARAKTTYGNPLSCDELYYTIYYSGQKILSFPYFLIYCVDIGLKPLEALKGLLEALKEFYKNDFLKPSLLQSIENSEDFEPEQYDYKNFIRLFPCKYYDASEIPSERRPINNNNDTPYDFFLILKKGQKKENPSTYNKYKFIISGSKRPYNSNLLEKNTNTEEKELVFVTEYIQAAEELETQIIDNYAAYLRRQLFDIAEKTGSDIYEMIDTNLAGNYQYYPLRPTHNVPAGDCIWIAPVGGYCTPWYSDWRLLEDRDVYIFKVGEKNPHIYLNQLLEVLDAIHRQLDENQVRIHFVIYPQKVSPNYKDNEIYILSVEDFFVQCKKNKVQIPEMLRGYYGKIMRKRTTARADEFIVEPILRKNDWILFSGEEGTGKSYFSIALGMAIANNRKMMFDWKLKRKSLKVLYVTDTEMRDNIINERLAVFRQIYNTRDNGLFFYEQVKNIDLTNEDEQTKMEKIIADYTDIGKEDVPVSVLILDHLLKLTGAKGDKEDEWPKVRKWLDHLTEELHLSVILVHHEYGGAKMLGTRLIANDVGTRLHFEEYLSYWLRRIQIMPKRTNEEKQDYKKEKENYEKLEKQSKTGNGILNMGVKIVKNRGGKKNFNPVYLGIDFNTKSLIDDYNEIIESKQSERTIPSSPTRKWRTMSQDDKISFLKKCLEEGMMRQDIADRVGMSIHTIAKAIDTFRKAGKLPLSTRSSKVKETDEVVDTDTGIYNAGTQGIKN